MIEYFNANDENPLSKNSIWDALRIFLKYSGKSHARKGRFPQPLRASQPENNGQKNLADTFSGWYDESKIQNYVH
ncbi:MAG TPA: hypothetical protein PKA10_17610 [Selenomonadales bacterium]|nr:hypothetical protein [Selenomonadales bacterium]